jgi:hypothetical protein
MAKESNKKKLKGININPGIGIDMIQVFDAKSGLSDSFKNRFPEVGLRDEFQKLSDSEIAFIWYIACRTSPLFKKHGTIAERIAPAARNVFGGEATWGSEIKNIVAKKGTFFPARYTDAIVLMNSFDVGLRLRAHFMNISRFNTYESMTILDDDDIEAIMVDPDTAKKYVDLQGDIAKQMPELIKSIEYGYGLQINLDESPTEGSTFEVHDVTIDDLDD